MAAQGDRFYQAVTSDVIANARRGQWKIRLTPTRPVPRDWLEPLADRQVLCLAGAGGQQAPILAAAGADVTVFDLSQRQISRDLEIAGREGLNINSVCGDMRDLSALANESFDLVVSPCATCFCPTVIETWSEVYRVPSSRRKVRDWND